METTMNTIANLATLENATGWNNETGKWLYAQCLCQCADLPGTEKQVATLERKFIRVLMANGIEVNI